MISVITPTYNRQAMLLEVWQSLLQQSVQDFEWLVIDDCSTDESEHMMRKLVQKHRQIRYFRNKQNRGPGYNRRLGFCQAQGEYIIFMDDDDFYTDRRFFEKALHAFKLNEKNTLAFVSAHAYIEYGPTKKRKKAHIGANGHIPGLEFLLGLKTRYAKPQSTFTTVFKRSVLEMADLANMQMVNDYAIYLRALLYGDAYILPDYVGVYRMHGNNISSAIQKDFLLENLAERLYVERHLAKQLPKKIGQSWWNRQMILLLKYYLLWSCPPFRDALAITRWIFGHSPFSFRLYGSALAILILYQPFNWLKRIKKAWTKAHEQST